MNSETAIDEPDFHRGMLSWMEKDLASVDRAATPFVIAHFHRPFYCSNDNQCTKSGDSPNRLTTQAEDMLYTSKVNVVLTGHVHDYERTVPVYKGKIMSPALKGVGESNYYAPIYILQGSSGNREGNKGDGSWPDASDLPEWSAAHSGDIGYGILRVQQGSNPSMEWTFYRSEDNEMQDQATLA